MRRSSARNRAVLILWSGAAILIAVVLGCAGSQESSRTATGQSSIFAADQKEIVALERADSIAQAEAARLDSLALVQQARRDSIDAAARAAEAARLGERIGAPAGGSPADTLPPAVEGPLLPDPGPPLQDLGELAGPPAPLSTLDRAVPDTTPTDASELAGVPTGGTALPDSMAGPPAPPPATRGQAGIGPGDRGTGVEPAPGDPDSIQQVDDLADFEIPEGVETPIYYATSPDARVWASPHHLWSFAEGPLPARDAFLYRIVDRRIGRERVLERQMLSAEDRARIDSLGFRYMPPTGRRLRTTSGLGITDQISADLEDERVHISKVYADAQTEWPVTLDMNEYLRRMTSTTVRRIWGEEARVTLEEDEQRVNRGGMVNIDLPIAIPSGLTTVFGEGKPNLSISGSERITFGGTSRWRPNELENEIGRRQSKFPQLNMEQQLTLKLTGTIGDKVSVDVDQTSNSTAPLANRIKIRYNGYEDEIIQSVDLGNTSLRLPGTRYVSYGGRAEGLFGINTAAKVGDVDFNMILTKQEGRSDSKAVTSSAEVTTVRIEDYQYVRNKYFFLRDPNGCPWRLDANSLQVYLDDFIGSNDREDGAIEGSATISGDPPSGDDAVYEGKFHILEFERDYFIQEELYTGHPLLILNQPLQDEHTLAIVYEGEFLVNVGGELAPSGDVFQVGEGLSGGNVDDLHLKMIRPTYSDGSVDISDLTTGPWAPIRNLELKNVYDLKARNILEDGFEVKIRVKDTLGGSSDPDRLPDGTTFLRLAALDLSADEGTGLRPGEDGRVDSEFINYETGVLFFPDLRPFDPTAYDLCEAAPTCGQTPNQFTICRFDPDGNSLRDPRPPWPSTPQDSVDYRAPGIYDQRTQSSDQENTNFYLEVTYKSPVTSIELNAFSILPESETVTASGRRLQRDVHYTIDYDVGSIEILDAANVTESDDIKVNYSYLPFAGGGSSKTLMGAAAFVAPDNAKWSASSTWLFESKGGVPGLEGRRPRLGEEPSRTLVGEFATSYDTDSWFMTDLVDQLPFLEARTPSRISMDAGLGISLPNPNTRDQLYIDDFEGAEDVLALSMNRRSWQFPSIPVPVLDESGDDSLATVRKGELWWYSPRATVQEWDLQPTLEDREGDDTRQIIEMKFFPTGAGPIDREASWGGIVHPLSTRGIDLSRAQFIDIWVNDFIPFEEANRREGKLIIDLGRVSEDAVWYRNDPDRPEIYRVVPPNGRLDSEDISQDDRLDEGTLREDAGMDTLFNGEVARDAFGEVIAEDHPFDDYSFDDDIDDDNERKFAHINGTEGNQTLDEEDLNGNDQLDVQNSYFQIELDLADPSLWETDVRRDFVVNDPGQSLTQEPDLDNGWRRLRVSLANDSLVQVLKSFNAADPDWSKIFHARMWVSGFADSVRLQLAGLEIVGNRWFENEMRNLADEALSDSSLAPGEDFFVGVLNNKDDRAVYDPPIELERRNEDNIQEREQSITIELVDFQPGHKASIYKQFPRAQDLSSLYREMEFFLNQRFERGRADLRFSVRLCKDFNSDTENYYEYRLPISDGWHLAEIDFAELSQLQLEQPDSLTGLVRRELGNGVSIALKGRPSLTSVQRITFAVENVGTRPLQRGNVWIDELRLNGVKKDTGIATRFSVDGNFADFASFNFNFERNGADFLRIGADRGSGNTATNWNARGSFNLEKFVEGYGFQLPLDVTLKRTRSVPKFQTNSDLVVEEPTDRDITERADQEVAFRYAKRGSEDPLLKYLIEPFSVSGRYARAVDVRPTVRDTSTTRSGTVSWSLPLQGLAPLRLTPRTELQLLPVSLSATLNGTEQKSARHVRSDLNEDFVEESRPDRTTASLNLGTQARPITGVTYTLSSSRNLNLQDNQQSVFGLNLGRESGRTQSLAASYDLPILRRILAPRASWNSDSRLTFLKQGGTAEDEPDRFNAYSNQRTVRINGRLSLSDLAQTIRGIGGGGDEDSTETQRPRPRVRGSTGGGGISVGAISVSYALTANTSFDRRKGEPDLLYQLGISQDLGRGARSLSRAENAQSKGEGSQLSFSTQVQLPFAIQISPSYSLDTSDGRINAIPTRSETQVWPQFDVSWGSLHQRLGIDRLLGLRTFSARTAYSRREEQTKSQGVDRLTESVNMQPLLNIQTTLNNGLQATLDTSFSRETSTNFANVQTETIRDNKHINLTVKKTLNLTRRITLPGSDREQVLQTRMTINAGIDYRADRQENRSAVAAPQVTRNTVNLKFTGSSSYQFTDRITGVATLEFGQDTDKKNTTNTFRFVGLSLSANFTF